MSSNSTSSLGSILLHIQQGTIRSLYSFYLIFGITGCCLNIILFSQRQFRGISCCTYFISSSVAMIINLGLGIGSSMYALDHLDPNTSIVAFCKLRIYLNQVVALTYRWSLSAACFDRYALSSTNGHLRNLARVYVARRIVLVIVIVWMILPIHTLIFYNLGPRACGIFNNIVASLYHSIFSTMVACILPSSIMFTCALLMRRNLALKRQRRQPVVSLQRDEIEEFNRLRDQQIIVMLFTQVIIYVISVIPLMVFYIYNAVTSNISNKSVDRLSIERFFGFVAEAMIYLFPASSFALYTMSSRTFRNELIKLLTSIFGCKCFINTNRIELITGNSTFRKVPGDLSKAIHSSRPGVTLPHHIGANEQQGNA